MKKSVKTYLLRTWNYSFFLYNCSAYLHLQASSHRYSVNSTIKNHGGISNNTVRRISTKSFWEIIVPQEWQVWYMRWHICEQTDGRSLDIYEPPGSVSASQDVHNHFDSLDLSDEKPHRLSRGVGKPVWHPSEGVSEGQAARRRKRQRFRKSGVFRRRPLSSCLHIADTPSTPSRWFTKSEGERVAAWWMLTRQGVARSEVYGSVAWRQDEWALSHELCVTPLCQNLYL